MTNRPNFHRFRIPFVYINKYKVIDEMLEIILRFRLVLVPNYPSSYLERAPRHKRYDPPSSIGAPAPSQ